jgi:hypothetical protein
MMRHQGLTVTVVLLLTIYVPASGQKSIDDVVVAGEVSQIVLCNHDEDAWIYRLLIRLHAKNVGSRPIIMSAASGIPDYYKFATALDTLSTKQYAHRGWVTSSSPSEPKTVAERPVKPFTLVAPKGTIDIDVELRAVVIAELKPGTNYLQIVAENWPEYSEEYIAKLKRAWSSDGILWVHSLHSEPIAFVVPSNLKEVRCP